MIRLNSMKRLILLSILLVVITVCGFFLFFGKTKNTNTKPQTTKNTVWSTPPPTLPLVQSTTDKNSKTTYSFPVFHISLQVPSSLKTMKELDPNSEDTFVGSDNLALFIDDSIFDPKTHLQIKGAKLSIILKADKKEFFTENEIVPTTSLKQASITTSLTPVNNILLTNKTMKVYSFPIDTPSGNKAWAYNAEALVNDKRRTFSITFYCVDYSSQRISLTCQKLLQEILPTLQVL